MEMSSTESRPSVGSAVLSDADKRYSPIRYRIGPLNYHPPVYCKCMQKAALWISWSDANPGRRYLKCYRARSGGCDFIGWYEGPHEAYVQSLLVDLRDEVWSLRRQRAAMMGELAEAREKLEEQKKQAAELKAAAKADGDGLRPKLYRAAVFGLVVVVLTMWLA